MAESSPLLPGPAGFALALADRLADCEGFSGNWRPAWVRTAGDNVHIIPISRRTGDYSGLFLIRPNNPAWVRPLPAGGAANG